MFVLTKNHLSVQNLYCIPKTALNKKSFQVRFIVSHSKLFQAIPSYSWFYNIPFQDFPSNSKPFHANPSFSKQFQAFPSDYWFYSIPQFHGLPNAWPILMIRKVTYVSHKCVNNCFKFLNKISINSLLKDLFVYQRLRHFYFSSF